ncbi:hypothetical protein RC62_3394 [Flavobacterium aquidurense]|uniref:Uncharacterized protein n=1 Tax=Flavobacterium aquidurense TaxID=362413 RepID=A0A0N8VNK6_9FLAO|nr:hypothetical protein RC62_3394 [Flavobacterium aquidurense]
MLFFLFQYLPSQFCFIAYYYPIKLQHKLGKAGGENITF